MIIAHAPITGQRKNGRILSRSNFKDQLDKLLKPHPKEEQHPQETVESSQQEPVELPPDREVYVFAPEDQRRIRFRKRLDALGIPYDEISTHSYRKGSASTAASGCTNGPPIVAICLRAGWKLGGVLNTYLCLENAGDCFVGRVAAGLPLLSPKFSVLPPKFPDEVVEMALPRRGRRNENTDTDTTQEGREHFDLINRAMHQMFGIYWKYGQGFATCLKYSLASLCFHKEWLEGLPPSHSFHHTWLARNPRHWTTLHNLVGPLRYATDEFDTRATGIPQYTELAKRQLRIIKLVLENRRIMVAMPDKMTDKIGNLLDEKGAMAGNITSTELRRAIEAATKSAASQAVAEALQLDRSQRASSCPAVVTDTEDATVPPQYHTWKDGSMHKLPEDYILSKKGDCHNPPHKATVLSAYHRWWFADKSRGVCRLRNVDFADFADKNQRKRYSDWKKVCTHLDNLASIPHGKYELSERAMKDNLSRTWQLHMKNVMYFHPSAYKR